VASGRLSADTGHRPCRDRDGGSRAHERDNTFIHSRPHRAPSGARVAVHLRGRSLAAECPWKWSFGLSPVAVTNLAVRGADIRDITHQIDRAHYFRPQVVLISGGGNDLLYYEAPLDAMRYDFAPSRKRAEISRYADPLHFGSRDDTHCT
jgi:hypothetical protein